MSNEELLVDVIVDGEGITLNNNGMLMFFSHEQLDLFMEELDSISELRQVVHPDYLPYDPKTGF